MADSFLALARLARSLGAGLTLSVVLLGLVQPRTFVWCRSETGHAALEALESGCCAGPGLGARCVPGEGDAEARRSWGGEALEGETCHDVLVEAPAGLPLDERSSAGPVAELARRPPSRPRPSRGSPRRGATRSPAPRRTT